MPWNLFCLWLLIFSVYSCSASDFWSRSSFHGFRGNGLATNHCSLARNQISKGCGLKNLGNTCYLNSILQALYNCERFRKQILATPLGSSSVSSSIERLFEELTCTAICASGTEAYLREIVEHLNLDIMSQEDAHEILFRLLEAIDRGNDHQILELFSGSLQTTLTEPTIGFTTLKNESFVGVSLDVEDTGEKYDVIQGLQKQLFGSENVSYVVRDHGHCNMTKVAKVNLWPSLLLVHLKRFRYDSKLNFVEKIFSTVSFTDYLRIEDITGSRSFNNGPKYKLSAVILHFGQPGFGHYICAIPDEDNSISGDTVESYEGNWLLFDDENIFRVSREFFQQLSFGSGSAGLSSAAYMLLYSMV